MKTLKTKTNCVMFGKRIADANLVQHSERVFGVRVVINGKPVANLTHGVSKAHCQRVFNNLSEADVDAELDGPVDDEGDGPSGFDFRQDMGDFRIRPFPS
jgi:hypothetical protein